ncbi:MAG: hypothetical protein AAFX78_02645 [Cyanobacteria bacterium J06638_20]
MMQPNAPQNPGVMMPVTWGTLRHTLTTAGGYWVAMGISNGDIHLTITGAVLIVLGAAWSWVDKWIAAAPPPPELDELE